MPFGTAPVAYANLALAVNNFYPSVELVAL